MTWAVPFPNAIGHHFSESEICQAASVESAQPGPYSLHASERSIQVYLHEHLVEMPAPLAAAPHPVDPAFPDLGGEHRAEPVTPEPHRLMADLDAAFRLSCDAPVLFDFDGLTRRTDNLDELPLLPPSVVRDEAWWDLRRVYVPPDPLLCLLPKRFRGNAVYFTLARETLPRIARGEVKTPGWQEAHRQLEIRYPEEPRPKPVQRFTTHRNWPWR